MKILIIGNDGHGKKDFVVAYTKNHIKQIKKTVPNSEIILTEDENIINNELQTADILLHPTGGYNFESLPIENAKNLKLVQTTSAGVTDIAAKLKNTKILLANASGVHPIPISETVLGYMLMFARRLNIAYKNQILYKTWSRDPGQVKGFELNGATVGVVGMGKIGSRIAAISKGLGTKVVYLQHSQNNSYKNYKDYKGYNRLIDVLKNADFVVNCLPLTPKTEGYFDMKKFEQMSSGARSASGGKKSSYFINIGRGKTVVEKDLIEALKKGLIAGAALDVFETEPLPANSPLWKMDDVILTPHVSGWTPEYTNRVVNIFCENLKAYIKGAKIPTLVDKKRGY
jgi:phosphoglycerate dehydrogenase-like enzyme